MDDTQQSRASDAAATRKRRSSILKSQRPARTPFSELEFNVATPTDTAKSRRVSFSRRTGVAEFVTNEATTTWKNFYEEHNKSLESSGNDSGANASRQPVGHLGKRLFDEQFEEVEAVDFLGTLNQLESNSLINNVNFTEQIASFDCTADGRLTAPKNKFELSAFTDQQSKLFGNDFTVACNETSGRIDVNFSAMQHITGNDDLDDIQRDLERQSNVACQGPFNDRQNMSEYIEVDLNMTHVAMKNDDDMSITETVLSPKVQEISKNADKNTSKNNDWAMDKENIAVNPYAPAKESENFALNDEPGQVLVFDGKRLTLQPENVERDRQMIQPKHSAETPQRKTIVLNVNDDLPNFVDDMLNSKCDNSEFSGVHELKSTLYDNNLSMTLPVNRVDIISKRKTIIDSGNISITQALPSNIFVNDVNEKSEKRKTILYEEQSGNISMTQALPGNIIQNNPERRRTVVYEDDTGNISITQAIPSNVLLDREKTEKRKTIVFDDDGGNISVTQAVSSNLILPEQQEKRKTIVFDDDAGNISITQAIPNILLTDRQPNDKRRTLIYEDQTGRVSVTEALPTIFTNEPERRRTILYDDGAGNISVTQAISNIILNTEEKIKDIDLTEPSNIPTDIILKDTDVNRRKTILYEEETGNISITQALPTNVIQGIRENKSYVISKESSPFCNENKRRTIVFSDDCDISVTQAIPTNIILPEDGPNAVVIENYGSNVSLTPSIPGRVFVFNKDEEAFSDKTSNPGSETSVPDRESLDKIEEDSKEVLEINEQIKPMIEKLSDDVTTLPDSDATSEGSTPISSSFTDRSELEMDIDKNSVDIQKSASFDKTDRLPRIPTSSFIIDNLESAVDITKSDNRANIKPVPGRVTVVGKIDSEDKVHEPEKLTKPTPGKVYRLEKYESSVDARVRMVEEVDEASQKVIDYDVYEQDVSMDGAENQRMLVINSEALPKVQSLNQDSEKRKTVLFDNENGNISMTKPIPADILAFQNEVLNKSNSKLVDQEPDQIANCPKVIVYQAATHSAPKLPNMTDQGDSQSNSDVIVIKHEDRIIDSRDSVREGSEEISLNIHPRVDEKTEVMNLKRSTEMDVDSSITTTDKQMSSESEDHPVLSQPKESVLDTLLDMSCSSLEGTEDKKLMTKIPSASAYTVMKTATNESSIESIFYITRESVEDARIDKQPIEIHRSSTKTIKIKEKPAIMNRPLPLEYKDEEDEQEFQDDLEKKLAQLKSSVNEEKRNSLNKIYEKLVNPDLEGIVERDENSKLRQQSLSFKSANDTKELLEMISDFTDNNDDDVPVRVRMRAVSDGKTEATSESKIEAAEPRRLSFAANRQSIVLSREDLLTNISMAQAALQKSRLELEESECIDDAEETKDTTIDHSVLKKSPRMSCQNEVVKTLHFDDESLSDYSMRCESKPQSSLASPLKKTAFGETSYMTETKAKVIPTYLKDVSDGIKELMLDLVKPMADTMPFEAGGVDKGVRKAPSTQSTQIQANLVTSSQIDMESEYYSNVESGYDIDKLSSGAGPLKSRSRSFRSPVKFSTNSSEKSSEFEVPSPRQRYQYSKSPEPPPSHPKVLVFDHQNPLNNILIGGMDYSDAHKYNPKRSDETLCGSERRSASKTDNQNKQNPDDEDLDLDNVTTQYHMQTRLSLAMQGDIRAYKNEDERSLISNVSKPSSIDQSIDAKVMELKDIEVNTLIAMKGNKELLEASSSLTLVDDAIGQRASERDVKKKSYCQDEDCEYHKLKVSRSPVEIIYKIEEQTTGPELTETSNASNDEETTETRKIKAKKRFYSPCVDKFKPPHVEITPKPNSKMQKISKSPNIYRVQLDLPITETATKMAAEKDTDTIEQKNSKEKRKSPKKKEKTPGASITVQQLITEYHVEAGLNQNILDKQILNALAASDNSTAPTSQSDLESNSIEVTSSFTSSKNLNHMKGVHSSSTTQSQQLAVQSQPSRVDWHPELVSAMSSNVYDSDSGVNVVAKIDMLPFMGSHECEWESSSADTWTFRLLHGRLRLTARLAHRHDNSTRTRVRGDTPVLDVFVETVQHDKKNPVATLCVRFAGETMRYMVSRLCRGPCSAADVPPLLRRCAAVARVALRWGRAMHDAKLHLAYTLDSEGYLTLKVANIPLRSVWEVSMRIELVVDDAREAPWPRAGNVRVARVVSDVSVADSDVRRALAHTPRDWGHAPRTIWRMFRYLKHKTRDDDILLGA
ncbi:uncharacterized protein LOC113492339 isoform X2 [Trichoplusia ni]|uniref:Uncharacterized protein LOC113492339 isoform X2 n=1 Tax=Trichoplusia ni TaxID=7111 RepID=A0A7E5VBE8_TRINI|nr:uncharacterized protein LOC113492339 isoform X2 [Trichoplusia ni]